jgi:hypothetical protein
MKQIVRLTESDLHRIVKKSVNKILRESSYDSDTVLVTRDVDCSAIQEQEFVQMMTQDVINAKNKWYDMNYENDLNRHNNWHRDTYNSSVKHAWELAQKHCRTARGRAIFFNKWMKLKGGSPNPSEFKWYNGITFFDVNIWPDRYGKNPTIDCRKDEEVQKSVQYIFNRIKDNPWFREASGWKLIGRSSRPEVKFIYDQEGEENWTNLRRKRDDDIMRFNSTLYYHGD